MTNGPISAALNLIRAAKADDVSADTAVDLHTAGLDYDDLISMLKLLFPFICELYAAKVASGRLMDSLDARTFNELVADLGELGACLGNDPSQPDDRSHQ